MKQIKNIFAVVLLSAFALSCEQEVDHSYSRFETTMEMTASAEEVVLNEATPDDVALSVTWTPAKDYGDDFIMSYEYEWNLYESTVSARSEYEDMGIFVREYTHEQLQNMMINDFAFKTSSWGTMQFTVVSEYEGPYIVLPEQARVEVKVKTYGPKQFAADTVYMAGTAAGDAPIKLTVSENNASLYVWTGTLAAGRLNFPVKYGDEDNVVVPAVGQNAELTLEPMAAAVVEYSENAPAWLVPSADDYRVSVNFESRTVSIVPMSSIMEVDRLFMAGSALVEEVEVTRTLENEALYAWRGELSSGQICFPVEFNGERNLTIVPSKAGHEILDGQSDTFTSVSATAAAGRYWEIPSAGTYRIVVDTDAKSVKIYSAATDMKNKTVVFKRTAGVADDNCTCEVTQLWMYGEFNDDGNRPGSANVLTQSLANPRLFIYKGAELPRKKAMTMKFLVTDNHNNEYAYGSGATGAAGKPTSVSPQLSTAWSPLYSGQGANRYSLFVVPEGTNYVEVYIGDESTDETENALSKSYEVAGSYVIFDKR